MVQFTRPVSGSRATANLILEALEELDPEKRRQVHAMLRLRIAVEIGGDMEITGVIGAGEILCESGPTSPHA